MSAFFYEPLSFLDRAFLSYERPTSHMHVGGVATFEAGALRKADGGIDVERIRSYVESRLHRIPRYRQVLTMTPIEGEPVWVDDPQFKIHYHVRHVSLPRPGDERQLKRMSGQIMSQQLDRAKPLWEIWIIEGLEDSNRFAMVSKVHHCMVDGVSSVDLLAETLTPEPQQEFAPALPWVPRRAPTPPELLGAELRRHLRAPLEFARSLGRHVEQAQGNLLGLLGATGHALGSGLQGVSSTPLNQPIGAHRRFDWLGMSLGDVKRVRRALGGSLNDIVLATTAGAVRRFLMGRQVDPTGIDFRVMAPVSMRGAEERGTLGNRVSAWMVDMPIGEPDPRKRLAQISKTTGRLKQTGQALGAEVLTTALSWTPSTLLSLSWRLAVRALPFNLVVTNVPGPQVPLYLLGSRMLDNYGLVPLTDYLALGIVLFSYDGNLGWGFTGDWDLLPDLHDFVLHTQAAFSELSAAAEPAQINTGGAQ